MSEKELERAVEKVKRLREGVKKRLMIKALVNYIDSMIGETEDG